MLVLNYEYPPLGGGAAPVCKQLAALFARGGHDLDVVTMSFRGLPRYEEHDGVRVTRVPALRRRQATCETHEMLSYVLSALPRVTARLHQRCYDIIHAHFLIPTGLLAYLATQFAHTPYAVTAHGSDVPGFNPDRFTREHRITKPVLRRIAGRAAWVSTPSAYLRDLIHTQLGPIPVDVIPNGIDVSHLTPRPKRRRILMTGRLLPRKGFQHVLDALRDVDTDVEVHIAGDGPMRADLEASAQSLPHPVVFHGWLKQDSPELKELYETSAVFCLPSKGENASVALLEAMLAGMALITSDATGCPETVGDAALLVPPGDVPALRRALRRLLDSEDERARLGEAARRRVLEHFDWKRIGARYLERLEAAARGERG